MKKLSATAKYISTSFLYLYLPVAFATTCYNPPQNIGAPGTAQDGTYTPCDATQQVTMCCRTKGPSPDTCLSNGLCSNIPSNGPVTYWRESCTDPTWKSLSCLRIFDVCSMDQNSNAPITPCPGTNGTAYCCGDNNTACCGTEFAIVVERNGTTPTATGAGTGTGISLSTGTSTSTSTQTPSPSSKPSLSPGAKAGIAIGAVALLLLAITALLLLIHSRKKTRNDNLAGMETIDSPISDEDDKGIVVTVIERPVPHFEFSDNTPHLHSYAGTWELPDRNSEARELDTNVPRRRERSRGRSDFE